ncbi:MAG: hypothetical protein M1812_005100 [Candelaria pacifica]|nr:MAG: hypothetical protein M1812_005100 [Candelaria pacifica]
MAPIKRNKPGVGLSYERCMDFGKDGLLGQGGNGKVYLVKKISNGRLLAEKNVITREGEITTELAILKDILNTGNERICNLKDFAQPIPRSRDGESYGVPLSLTPIYLEYCECGDLWDLIVRHMRHEVMIPESFIFHVFKQIAEALVFLHWGYDVTGSVAPRKRPNWRQVLHRDVKAENIFMTYRGDYNKKYPNVVLGDFGWATLLEWDELMLRDNIGTACYRAPESCGAICVANERASPIRSLARSHEALAQSIID